MGLHFVLLYAVNPFLYFYAPGFEWLKHFMTRHPLKEKVENNPFDGLTIHLHWSEFPLQAGYTMQVE